VLYESAPGQVAVKAMHLGAHQSGRRSKDVTRADVAVDGLGQACFVSLLPSAFRLLYVALRAKQ
jgi:hypothetical protein